MKRYLGQMCVGGKWVSMCIPATDIYDANNYIQSIANKGSTAVSPYLTPEEHQQLNQDIRDRY